LKIGLHDKKTCPFISPGFPFSFHLISNLSISYIRFHRPGQKALIVSGFSETKRVKKAQKLGAGAYVKKPFLLEKIGVAVRDELDK
jgi:ActR/RegA family two-component response regulator